MAITVRPIPGTHTTTRSRNPSTKQGYRVRSDDGAITRNEAYDELLKETPDVRDGLLRNQMDLSDTQSGKVWNAEVLWRIDGMPSENAPIKWKGSTRGGRAKINRSLSTRQAVARPGYQTIDYGGAIEVDDKGNVNGTEIHIPALEFSVDVFIPSDLFTYSYMRLLYQFTPSTNSKRWGPFLPNECLFLGAEWSPSTSSDDGTEMTQLTYYFEAGAKEELTIGDLPTITKKPFDHIWFSWETYKDAGGTGLIFRRPRQANVEVNYPERNFAKFGLGI